MIRWTFEYVYHYKHCRFVSYAESKNDAIKDFKEHLKKEISHIEDVTSIVLTPTFEKVNLKIENIFIN